MTLQEVFKWSSASFALIPGLIVMSTNLGTPPGISAVFYGGLIEAVGAFTLTLMLFNKTYLGKWPEQKVNRVAISMFILFFIFLLLYIFLYNSQVIYNDKFDTFLFFPLWYGDDLSYMVTKSGAKYQAISNYGAQAITDAINNPRFYLVSTIIIFTALYVMVFEFLVIGFGLLGLRNST